MEVLLGDRCEGSKLVQPRVVNQNIKATVVLDRRVDNALSISCFGNIAAYSDRLATCFDNRGNNSVCSLLAGGIINDNGSALGS